MNWICFLWVEGDMSWSYFIKKLELIVGRIFFKRREVNKDAFLYEAPGLAGFLPLRINWKATCRQRECCSFPLRSSSSNGTLVRFLEYYSSVSCDLLWWEAKIESFRPLNLPSPESNIFPGVLSIGTLQRAPVKSKWRYMSSYLISVWKQRTSYKQIFETN